MKFSIQKCCWIDSCSAVSQILFIVWTTFCAFQTDGRKHNHRGSTDKAVEPSTNAVNAAMSTDQAPTAMASDADTATIPLNAVGCESEWRCLLSLKRAFNDIPDSVKYTRKWRTKVDSVGYVLVTPAHAVEQVIPADAPGGEPGPGEEKSRPADRQNAFSFWAFFKCQNGRLVHDHCRVADATNPYLLKVPLTEIAVPLWLDIFLKQNKRDDNMAYICRESNSTQITAAVIPYAGETKGEVICDRIDQTQWCGRPFIMEAEGCQDDWNEIQRGHYVENHGAVTFDLEPACPDYENMLYLQIICVNRTLTMAFCLFGDGENNNYELSPGSFVKHGNDFAQVEIVKGTITLPPGFNATSSRKNGDGGDSSFRWGSLSARFVCPMTDVHLFLAYCLVDLRIKILPGHYYAENGQYFNCGHAAETTDSNVASQVTKTKQKVHGLKHQPVYVNE